MQLLHLGSFSADFGLQIKISNRQQNKTSTFTIPRKLQGYTPRFFTMQTQQFMFLYISAYPPVFVQRSFDLNLVFTEDLADTDMLTGHGNFSISCTRWSFHTKFCISMCCFVLISSICLYKNAVYFCQEVPSWCIIRTHCSTASMIWF